MSQCVRLDAGVDALVHVHRAAIEQAQSGGVNLKVVGRDGAVGDAEVGLGSRARLWPAPGEIALSKGDSAPKILMSQSRASCTWR